MALRKPVVVSVLSVVLLLIMAMDFLFWEPRRDASSQSPTGGSEPEFTANVDILGIAFDDRTRSATATLELEVKATSKNRDINRVTYRYQVNPDGTSSNLVGCRRDQSECFTEFEDIPTRGGPNFAAAKVRHIQMPIIVTEDRSEIWYPFDRFSFRLDFGGWVNKDVQGDPNLTFERLTIKDAEPNLILRQRSDRYLLERRPFIRIVSIVFFLLSIAFLWYLVHVGDPKDLLAQSLGFFGALWGLRSLLLPSSVTVFPTLVDYVILTEFCILFMIIVSKIPLPRRG